MVKDIYQKRYMVKLIKAKKFEKKKSKLLGHVIDHALHCSKIVTNDSHHLPKD